jgi:hypothetical protein
MSFMKSILVLFFVITVFSASAQKENIPTTEIFSIEGKVKKNLTISLADLSWNEIFNSNTGNSVYILTEQDGKPASALDNRIALVSPKDQMTGRRYVKSLQKIVIERVK